MALIPAILKVFVCLFSGEINHGFVPCNEPFLCFHFTKIHNTALAIFLCAFVVLFFSNNYNHKIERVAA